MIRNQRNKLKIFIIFLIVITVILMCVLKIREEKSYEIPISVVNRTNKRIEHPDIQYIIKYNTIFIPMNEIFTVLMGDNYIENTNQTLNYNDCTFTIDINKNIIIFPNKLKINEYEVNNSVEVEIEEFDGKKYIPIYLISNLPKVDVKVDGKDIFNNSQLTYTSEALDKNRDNHKVVIYTECDDKSLNEDYWGESNGSLWREEALKRIEKYRKENIEINVYNQNGEKLNIKNLSIKMKNNKFLFGTAINQMNTESISKKYFNMILSENSYKWKVTEQYGYNTADKLYKYASDNNYTLKAHTLWWDYIYSSKLKELVKSEDKEKITFEYIYNKYNEKEITEEETNNLLNNLKQEFENIVYAHIQEEVSRYPNVQEWDVVNEITNLQFFKYYLYDRHLLDDDNFLTDDTKYNVRFNDNKEYYNFIVNCFNKTREINPNAKLILNDEKVKGYNNSRQYEEIKEVIKKLKNTIDAFGIQCHINNKYSMSPQSYFNQINEIVNETGIKDIIISEYDNYTNSKLNNYTKEEKITKARYLRDFAIMSYSNLNVSEFTMWVYNMNHFCNEERQYYEELVEQWLNYSEEVNNIENSKYTTRVYDGEYDITVKLENGKIKTVQQTINSNNSDNINIIIKSSINKIEIVKEPNKSTFYRNDNLDLSGGILRVYYDDNTTKDIELNDENIQIDGFDSNNIGKKKLTIKYENKETYYEINVVESIENSIKIVTDNLTKKNKKLKKDYNIIDDKKYQDILNSIENLNNDINNNNNDRIEKLYEQQINIANDITTKYINNQVTIDASELNKCITDILAISDAYKELYKYYVTEDIIENSTVKEKLNGVIDKYNNNTDIDLSKVTDLINTTREIYNTSINTDNVSDNYLNKQRILKTCEIINLIIDNDIRKAADEDSNNVTITYNVDANTLTNQDVYVTINLPTDKAIIANNEQNAPYIFKENGTKTITINIRGYEYTYNISVKNIDKTAPKIDNVEQLNNSVTPQISDDNLQNVELKLDGNLKLEYQVGQTITTPGMYNLTAKDKAGNVTITNFIIYDTYNENNQKINYIPIYNVTTLKNLKNNINMKYTITKNNQEINENDYISAGCEIQINNKKYYLIVKGDINGDGKVTGTDLVKVRRYLIGLETFTPVEKVGAILSQRNDVSINDLAKMRKIILQ
ncbi:unknown [Clostridium sp. CAG:793]|nr:unknown [Clostridium sp. CAG:793]